MLDPKSNFKKHIYFFQMVKNHKVQQTGETAIKPLVFILQTLKELYYVQKIVNGLAPPP